MVRDQESTRPGAGKGWPSRLLAIACVLCGASAGQVWDIPEEGAKALSRESREKLQFTLESRVRAESRSSVVFGKDPDVDTGLVRTRFGLNYTPSRWLKISGMLQDSRAPWYGPNAPNTVRDSVDLHEAYFELFPDAKAGFHLLAGRKMLNYGEGRLLGTPQWSNLARTYDQARASYKLSGIQLEMLYVSPVKIRPDDFNKPVLGDHVWGMYDTIGKLPGTATLDVYVLRHNQNRPGGFTGGSSKLGTDTLGVNTFGARFAGRFTPSLSYSVEGALQNGHVGPARHRGQAWFSSLTRRWNAGPHPLDISGEYKYASGTANPQDPARVSTFDQLYPANHDKFGHEDLFGWRNIHNARSLTTFGVSGALTANFMYDNSWLASSRDALYNGAGRSIARSADGSAGRHVGQETDLFVTYKYRHFTFGAGGGYLFKGEFIRKATPGSSPIYGYLFYTYSI